MKLKTENKMRNAGSSVAMKFMTPEKYSKSQESHFILNGNAVNEFVEICGPLNQDDKVLDFGSGTGETTSAMAQVNCHDIPSDE